MPGNCPISKAVIDRNALTVICRRKMLFSTWVLYNYNWLTRSVCIYPNCISSSNMLVYNVIRNGCIYPNCMFNKKMLIYTISRNRCSYPSCIYSNNMLVYNIIRINSK